jgi:hypothetical protein
MSRKAALAILAGLIASFAAVEASADIEANRENGKFTCPGKAVKQDWMLIATNGVPFYCKLSVDKNNNLSGDCFEGLDPDTRIKATGDMSVTSKCEVSGTLTLKAGGEVLKADITANMTKSQTTIIGITVGSKGSDKGRFGTFSAIRMEQ